MGLLSLMIWVSANRMMAEMCIRDRSWTTGWGVRLRNCFRKAVTVSGAAGAGTGISCTQLLRKANAIFSLQMNCSMVITDPKGTLIEECGKMLAKGPPKKDKNGNIMKDKSGKVVHEPYVIKVLNTINFSKSLHYNPFAYIRSEKDILKLVTTIIVNTKGEGEKADVYKRQVL